MAEIYLAKAKGIGGFEKLLALKMIHPRFSEDDHFINMLIEEAKISVQLNHVNIGQIFDLGRIEETYYIAMEYIEGADVYRTMRRASEMGVEVPVDTAVYVAQEICAGLDYAHRKRDAAGKPLKIIHRDISPQNVLISFAGEVKIVDFGIAKASLRAKETEVGVIKGKYYYMSPEQAWGDPVDHRTDIFSTGIILYEMLTGQMLYMEDNVPALLDRVRKADITPASSRRPEIPKPLDEIVMKTLAKYPDDRYQTAHELQTALTRFLFSFSPDYTASMLSGLVGWLFADEIKRPSAPPAAPKAPVPPRDSSEDSLEIMTGDELAEEVVVKSVIFDMEDLTSVRAAKAMAAMRKESLPPPPDDEKTSLQAAVPPGTRAPDDDDGDGEGEGEEETGVWGDETLIDRDHKFKEIAEHYRNLEAEKRRAAGKAPATAPADGEAETEAALPPSEAKLQGAPPRRAPDQETRPVEIADVPKRRPPAPAPVGAPSAAPADQERTLRAQSRASSGAVPPLVISPPTPVAPPPSAPLPAPPARPPSAAIPAPVPRPTAPAPPGPRPTAAAPPTPRSTAGMSSGAVPRAAAPSVPPPPPAPRPVGPPPRGPGIGKGSTMMGPAVAPPPPPPFTGPAPMVTPPTPQVAIGRDSLRDQDIEPMEQAPTMAAVSIASHASEVRPASGPPSPIQITADEKLGGTLSDSAMTHVATPALGRRGTASAAVAAPPMPAPAPAPRPVAPVAPPPIASAQTKPIQAPAATAKAAHIIPQPDPRSLTGGIATESPSAPLVVHDPFTASYLAAQPRPTGARTLLWVVAAAVLAVGVVVATVVFLSPPAAEPCVLEITSHPPGARVTVGDTPVNGTTPLRVEGLQAGQSYQLEVVLDGFQPWRQQFQASPGVIQQIAILDAVRGTLQIQSNPPGAQIYIDNVYRGSTPLTIPGLEITRPITVRAERAGFIPEERHLAFSGQTQATTTFDLRPLPR